jgi:phosphoglycolate phosphatase-like HAD superfamily hydrolase
MNGTGKKVLLIFDVDGTLLKNKYAVRDVFLQAFYEVTGSDAVRRKPEFAGMTDRGIFRAMLEDAGVEGDYESLYGKWEERFSELLDESYPTHPDPRTLPGVEALLEELEARGDVFLALGTGNTRRSCATKLRRFGLDRFFPVGGYGGDHEQRHDVVRAAMAEAEEHYGSFDEVWVIGDTERDIAAARAAGARVLAVATGLSSIAELREARPEALVPDLVNRVAFYEAVGLAEPPEENEGERGGVDSPQPVPEK